MRLPLIALCGLLLATPALAGDGDRPVTADQLDAMKSAWKAEQKQSKEIAAIARRWTAAWNQDNAKKMHAIDEDLVAWRKEVLGDLRADGISTKEAGTDQGAPAQERLRDLLVELRDGQDKFDNDAAKEPAYRRKAELLSQIVAEMSARVQRMERRYESHKDQFKAQKKAS
jgi:hypothetical protein